MMPRVPHAATVLARGLALHLDALRSGSEEERQRSLGGLTLLRDFGVRLGIVAVGRALDHLLVPDFRRIEVRAPLFVVAPPRSGTTLLYNLLARDPGLVGIRLYESLLPSLTLLDLVDRLAAGLDDDARLRRAFLEHEQSLFADLDPIHRIRYGELEEDTTLFDRHMVCPTALRFFPHGERLAPYLTLDDQPPATRRAVMQAYRRAVQRVLHRSPGRSYLAKNIASAGRIGSLLETFPDARMINIVRHPYQVLPSALRLVDRTFGMGLPDGRRPELPPDDGQPAIVLEGVEVCAAGRPLLSALDLRIGRERLAVMGPNGAGKTSLLRVMLGQRSADAGSVRLRAERIGAIAQGATDWESDESLLWHLHQGSPDATLEQLATMLVEHRFPLALAQRPLRSLSPGERVRAALLCLFARAPAVDLLVLDEPTNGLDFVGMAALQRALRAWPGGLVVASHDRELLEAIGIQRVLVLDGRGSWTSRPEIGLHQSSKWLEVQD